MHTQNKTQPHTHTTMHTHTHTHACMHTHGTRHNPPPTPHTARHTTTCTRSHTHAIQHSVQCSKGIRWNLRADLYDAMDKECQTDMLSGPTQICWLGLHSVLTSLVFSPAGRAIRHREDYAVIVLADQRYARPSVTCKLPAWISRQLSTLDKFPPALQAVSKVAWVGKEARCHLSVFILLSCLWPTLCCRGTEVSQQFVTSVM